MVKARSRSAETFIATAIPATSSTAITSASHVARLRRARTGTADDMALILPHFDDASGGEP